MAEVITDEQMKSIADDVKKQIVSEAKSVQDFEKITELPESGSVTLPVVQPDGSCKTFDAGNWLKKHEDTYKATEEATADAQAATTAANNAADSANAATTAANNAADVAKKRTDELNATDVSQLDNRVSDLEGKDIDDKYKKSNYNDGDDIIDFNTIHLVVDDPEFIFCYLDAQKHILFGMRVDGSPCGAAFEYTKNYIDTKIEQLKKELGK